MNEEMMALARRAVACRGWRWMAGMLTHDGYRTAWSDGGLHQSFKLDGYEAIGSTEQLIPDLSDPATLGCLLALVREAWGDHGFYVAQSNTRIKDTDVLGWDFFGSLHGKSCKGMLYRYEAEALVAALEAAP